MSMRNLFLVTLLCIYQCYTDAAELRRTWTLYHSMDPKLGDKGFTKRGVVTLEPDNNELKLTVENDDNSFTTENINTMMASGWYQVKLVEDGPKKDAPVMTTIPACQLRLANFRDEITLSFGQQGHVISLTYSPLVSPLAPKTCDEFPAPPADIKFNSKVEYETAVPGMSLKTVLPNYQPPPGLKFISSKHKAGGGGGSASGDAKPEGFETKEEQETPNSITGFMQKYWYILLPIMLMNLFAAEPEQPQQGQQGGGGSNNNAAVQGGGGQAAASGSGGGGSSGKRRGKRG